MLCDMADQAGCKISEIIEKFSAYELNLRITNRLIQAGYTFDHEKIAEIERQKEKADSNAFLERARTFWKGGK